MISLRNRAKKLLQQQRKYFDWFAEKYGIQTQEQWYAIDRTDIINNAGRNRLLPSSSFANTLCVVYPEFTWHPWLFSNVPRSFWREPKNRREYLDWLANHLDIETQDGFYQLTTELITSKGGSGALSIYANSVFKYLKETYREFEWVPWLFSSTPNGFWDSKANRKSYFDWLEGQLDIRNKSDWYQVKLSSLINNGGNGIIYYYRGSLVNALHDVYPEYDWHLWKFEMISNDYWNHFEQRKKFLDWFASGHNITSPTQWFHVSSNDIKQQGGAGLLEYYNNTLHDALCSVYPTTYSHYSHVLWRDFAQERHLLDWFSEELGIKTSTDWYRIGVEDVVKVGGADLIRRYDNSGYKMLSRVYPEYDWKPWLFLRVSRRYWDDSQNQRKFFDWIAQLHNIQKPTDWIQIGRELIIEQGGGGLLSHHNGSFYKCLRNAFPEHDWMNVFGFSDGQQFTFSTLKSILKCEVLMNYKHPHLVHPASKRKMELDIYIPEIEVAFEYQGGQHYKGSALHSAQQLIRDQEKRGACKELGISLIEIPYWWDFSVASFVSTIRRVRPDVPLSSIFSKRATVLNNIPLFLESNRH